MKTRSEIVRCPQRTLGDNSSLKCHIPGKIIIIKTISLEHWFYLSFHSRMELMACKLHDKDPQA